MSIHWRPVELELDQVDLFYVPGVLAHHFGWLAMVSGASMREGRVAHTRVWCTSLSWLTDSGTACHWPSHAGGQTQAQAALPVALAASVRP